MTSGSTIHVCAWSILSLIVIGTAHADPDVQVSSAPAPVDVSSAAAAVEPSSDVTVAPTPYAVDDCTANDDCIDQYLWSLYERTPKIDAVRTFEQRKVTVKRKGKSRTTLVRVARYGNEDFTWKDVAAADMNGLSLKTYVIGGMDPDFKRTLYVALRRMDDAGLMPGITSAFRDDYRQSIASGNKAQVDRSYHGGSTRGGYGHGLAVDLVSVRGATRAERCLSRRDLWTWIDANGAEVGIGRPYRDRDAPHVALIGGEEYAKHRGGGARTAAAKTTVKTAAAKTPATKTPAAKTPAAKTTGRQVARNESRHGRRAGALARPARGMAAKAATAKTTAANVTKTQRPAVSAHGRARQVRAPQPATRSRT